MEKMENAVDFDHKGVLNDGDKVSVDGEEGKIEAYSDGATYKIFPPSTTKRYMFKPNNGIARPVTADKIKLISRATNTINWSKPYVYDEVDEYFENEDTEKWLQDHGLDFDKEKELTEFLKKGRLIDINEADLQNIENIMVSDDGFESDEEYSKSLKSMEKELGSKGSIKLDAPIVIEVKGDKYLFSGNCRINLAVKHHIPIKIWIIRS
jgi:hypothetical protein